MVYTIKSTKMKVQKKKKKKKKKKKNLWNRTLIVKC